MVGGSFVREICGLGGPKELLGASCRYRANCWEQAVPVPAHVPRVRPRHGLLPQAMPTRARVSSGRAVLGLGPKIGPRAELTGSGCMALYTVGRRRRVSVWIWGLQLRAEACTVERWANFENRTKKKRARNQKNRSREF